MAVLVSCRSVLPIDVSDTPITFNMACCMAACNGRCTSNNDTDASGSSLLRLRLRCVVVDAVAVVEAVVVVVVVGTDDILLCWILVAAANRIVCTVVRGWRLPRWFIYVLFVVEMFLGIFYISLSSRHIPFPHSHPCG